MAQYGVFLTGTTISNLQADQTLLFCNPVSIGASAAITSDSVYVLQTATTTLPPPSVQRRAASRYDAPTMAPELIFGAVFGLVGAALLLGAGRATMRAIRLLSDAHRVEGRVVRLKHRGTDRRGRAMKLPVVEFPYLGVTRVLEGTVGTIPPRYDVGATVTVLLPQAEPEGAVIKSFDELYFLPVLMGGLGVLSAGIGVLIGRAAP